MPGGKPGSARRCTACGRDRERPHDFTNNDWVCNACVKLSQPPAPLQGLQPTETQAPALHTPRKTAPPPMGKFCNDPFEHAVFRPFEASNYLRVHTLWRGYAAASPGQRRSLLQAMLRSNAVTEPIPAHVATAEEQAVYLWSCDLLYKDLNQALLCDDLGVLMSMGCLMRALTHFIETHPPQQDTTVWRGTKVVERQMVPIDRDQEHDMGLIFRQPMFQSTSTSKAVVRKFLAKNSPVMEFLVPKGCRHCAQMPPEFCKFPEEQEWIMAPYTPLKFVSQEFRDFVGDRRLVVTYAVLDSDALAAAGLQARSCLLLVDARALEDTQAPPHPLDADLLPDRYGAPSSRLVPAAPPFSRAFAAFDESPAPFEVGPTPGRSPVPYLHLAPAASPASRMFVPDTETPAPIGQRLAYSPESFPAEEDLWQTIRGAVTAALAGLNPPLQIPVERAVGAIIGTMRARNVSDLAQLGPLAEDLVHVWGFSERDAERIEEAIKDLVALQRGTVDVASGALDYGDMMSLIPQPSCGSRVDSPAPEIDPGDRFDGEPELLDEEWRIAAEQTLVYILRSMEGGDLESGFNKAVDTMLDLMDMRQIYCVGELETVYDELVHHFALPEGDADRIDRAIGDYIYALRSSP